MAVRLNGSFVPATRLAPAPLLLLDSVQQSWQDGKWERLQTLIQQVLLHSLTLDSNDLFESLKIMKPVTHVSCFQLFLLLIQSEALIGLLSQKMLLALSAPSCNFEEHVGAARFLQYANLQRFECLTLLQLHNLWEHEPNVRARIDAHLKANWPNLRPLLEGGSGSEPVEFCKIQ